MQYLLCKGKYEISAKIVNECIEIEPNTYQCASMPLKTNVELAPFFLKLGRSFSFVGKHLRNRKEVGLLAVEIDPKSCQFFGKNLRDYHDIFDFAVENNEKMMGYASERLRKLYV